MTKTKATVTDTTCPACGEPAPHGPSVPPLDCPLGIHPVPAPARERIEWTPETQRAAAILVDQWGPVLGSQAVADAADSAELIEIADAIVRGRRDRGFAGYGCNARHDTRHDAIPAR